MSCIVDEELHQILKNESKRQNESIELIASENLAYPEIHFFNGSIFTNKYAEGYPDKRYYGGCKNIDQLEKLTQKRALQLFNLDTQDWDVNVQSYSGSIANFSIYSALLEPGDSILGLGLTDGGHLSHGYKRNNQNITNSSKFFKSYSYGLNEEGYIDYLEVKRLAYTIKPKLIIVGASAYPRDFNYNIFSVLCSDISAYLLADISHISGLIASKFMKNPFEYCDIVMTTTHKMLKGPRAALIYAKTHLIDKINKSVFPGSQGGPHYNTISAICYMLYRNLQPEYYEYTRKILYNAQTLANCLLSLGFKLQTNGTSNHLILINLSNFNITGSKFEYIAELCHISVNKNCVKINSKESQKQEDTPLSPHGIRIGTCYMTSKGFNNKDFIFIGHLLKEIVILCQTIQSTAKSKKLIHFKESAVSNYIKDINDIKSKVKSYLK